MRSFISLTLAALFLSANAHVAPWHPAMYCFNGNQGNPNDENSSAAHNPLYMLKQKEWWFHAVNGCDKFPPKPGVFLDLPAGGSFPMELALNRAFTTMSYGGNLATDWPGGDKDSPDRPGKPPAECIIAPNIHTQNETNAAGTAFAISYTSKLEEVTPETLSVFTVRHHTPWKRKVSYDVPAALPECPPEGCICAWGWVPYGCGEPNMYMIGFRCRVVGATSKVPVAKAKPPVYCEADPSKCVTGSKQMIYWHQAEGNNIETEGTDLAGNWKSPGYNPKCGFADGPQNDIFELSANVPSEAPVTKGLRLHKRHPRAFTRRAGAVRF